MQVRSTPTRSGHFLPLLAVSTLAALAVAVPTRADALGLVYHSDSTVIGGARYFHVDIFAQFDEPCGRVLNYWQTALTPIGFSGPLFHAEVFDSGPSILPTPFFGGEWAVDSYVAIGGRDQPEMSTLVWITPDWDFSFGTGGWYQPGCVFVVPPVLPSSFAGEDHKLFLGRFTITETQFNTSAALQFSARFGVSSHHGSSVRFHEFSVTAPFSLLPGGTTDAGDEPAMEGQCYSGSGGGGGCSNLPAGVVSLNPRSFDFNGDDRFDLMWHHAATGHTTHWLLDGTARVGGGAFPWQTPPSNVPIGAGDTGDDGSPEVFFFHPYTRQVYMWSFVGNQRSALTTLFVESVGWTPVAIGDFTGDGRADVLSRSDNRLQYRVRPIYQTNVYAPRTWTTLPLPYDLLMHADLDRDGIQDLILRAPNGVCWGRRVDAAGITTMVPMIPYGLGTEWVLAAVGDFDGDDDDDMLWHNASNGEVRAWEIESGVKVGGALVRTGIGPQYRVISTLDTDNDGDDDIVWRDETNGNVYAWRMQGLVRESGSFVRNVALQWRVVNP